ncbi:MAG: hypothetical protein EP330_21790 [Deltaproteobacteria bacterium]|nr:MAG: hypothetical protein EP330_21790 [Deltaproteobacteria bacterium]
MRICVLLSALLVPSVASAVEVGQSKNIGVGLVLGEPSGITGKFYLSRQHALDATLGTGTYDQGRDSALWFSLVYLWHPSVLHQDPAFDLGWHVGVGGFVVDHDVADNAAVGARVPIGLDFTLNEVPLQFFLDVSADVEILPDPVEDIWLGAGLGGRYFF